MDGFQSIRCHYMDFGWVLKLWRAVGLFKWIFYPSVSSVIYVEHWIHSDWNWQPIWCKHVARICKWFKFTIEEFDSLGHKFKWTSHNACSVVWLGRFEPIVFLDRFGGEPWYKCSQRWSWFWRALSLQHQGIGAKKSPARSKLARQRPSLIHSPSSPSRRAPTWKTICRAS